MFWGFGILDECGELKWFEKCISDLRMFWKMLDVQYVDNIMIGSDKISCIINIVGTACDLSPFLRGSPKTYVACRIYSNQAISCYAAFSLFK